VECTYKTNQTNAAPRLSLIIPAYNEASRLPASLDQIKAWMQTLPYEIEILVIENGSHDRTYQIAISYADQIPNLHVYQSMKGKGAAVHEGVMRSHGDYLFICDADLSMPITEVHRFLQLADTGYDIVIGSREALGAIRYDEPHYRHFMGRVFNSLVRWLATPGFYDTQCGFKLFRRKVAQDLFALQTIYGWSFDVEILYLALKRDFAIAELPIEWFFSADSRVNPLQDTWLMLLDLFRIRLNDLQGVYTPKRLKETTG
jgi:dolichyl-phosphate beta-glucosyltransferase